MKKTMKWIIPMAGIAASLAACGKQETPPPPSVLDDKVLVVGLLDTEDRSCYRMVDENGTPFYAGWEPDILGILDNANQEITLEYRYASDRAELISWLNTGEVELAAGSFSRMEAYSTQYNVSDEYGIGSIYIVNKKNGYLDTLVAFQDESVGVSAQIPVNKVGEITGIDGVTQKAYADVAVLGHDIENGDVTAGLCTEDEAMYLLRNTELQAAELRGTPQISLVFLSQLGQDYLMEWVNYAIDQHFQSIAKGVTGEEEENAGGGQ